MNEEALAHWGLSRQKQTNLLHKMNTVTHGSVIKFQYKLGMVPVLLFTYRLQGSDPEHSKSMSLQCPDND